MVSVDPFFNLINLFITWSWSNGIEFYKTIQGEREDKKKRNQNLRPTGMWDW